MSAIQDLLGATVLSKEGEVQTSSLCGKDKVVGVYFSASWCPPCRGFTPVLAKFYDNFKANHARKDDLFIVFVSSDRDEKNFEEYYSEMPFYALPYKHRDTKVSRH